MIAVKINEVEPGGPDDVTLKLKNIRYDFEQQIQKINSELMIVRSMPKASTMYSKFYNAYVLKNMKLIMNFLTTCANMNVPKDDPDCIKATEIYNELNKIQKP